MGPGGVLMLRWLWLGRALLIGERTLGVTLGVSTPPHGPGGLAGGSLASSSGRQVGCRARSPCPAPPPFEVAISPGSSLNIKLLVRCSGSRSVSPRGRR